MCRYKLEFASFLRLGRDLSSDQKVFERFFLLVSDNGGIRKDSRKVWVVRDQRLVFHLDFFEFRYTWVVGGDER